MANPVFSAVESLAPDGSRGKRILSSLLCGQTANQVIASTTAASYLLGEPDHMFTHETHPIDPAIAAIIARRRLSPLAQQQHNSEAFNAEQSVHLVKTNDATKPCADLKPDASSASLPSLSFKAYNFDDIDFLYRSALFNNLPFVLYHMRFYRDYLPDESHVPKTDEQQLSDTRQQGPFRFKSEHPQVLPDNLLISRERRQAMVPQFLRDPPMRPSSEGSSEDKEAYAEYALGNFVSDRNLTLTGDTLWSQFLDWEERERLRPSAIGRIVIRMLENLQLYVCGKTRDREARKAKKLKVNQLGKRLRDLMGFGYGQHTNEAFDSDDEDKNHNTWASIQRRTFDDESTETLSFSFASGKSNHSFKLNFKCVLLLFK